MTEYLKCRLSEGKGGVKYEVTIGRVTIPRLAKGDN